VGTLGERLVVYQEFNHGQHCDETNKARISRATVMCCVNYPFKLSPRGEPFVASTKETRVCEYDLVVCVPALCELEGFKPMSVVDREVRCPYVVLD
jgi:hypothetical protein